MSFKQSLENFLSGLVGDGKRFKTNTALAEFCGVVPSYSLRLRKKGVLDQGNLGVFVRFLDTLGVRLELEAGQAREVCFVNVNAANAEAGSLPVASEDYAAIPLISEAGAGPGVIPYSDNKSWFLVDIREPSLRSRKVNDLFAVRVAKGSTSMEPTLHPGDVVLIDPNDKAISRPGGIFLVMEPDGSGKIKRVNMENVPTRKLTRLTYYSDNVQENAPEVYILEDDYEGNLERAIVGRVIWAWSDLSKK